MRFPRIVACLLVTVTVMGQTSGKSGDSAFLKLADQFVHESLALSPSTASQAGYHKHRDPKTGKQIDLDAELDDIGPTASRATRVFTKAGGVASLIRDQASCRTLPTSGSSKIKSTSICSNLTISRITSTTLRFTSSCLAALCFSR